MKKFLTLLFFYCFINTSMALPAQDMYAFQTDQQQQQFNALLQQLRCLVCQNETLADSNATLAKDLRHDIATMVQQGQSNQAIINYLVKRYGNFILYQPPLTKQTLLLWFGPVLLLLIGLTVFMKFLRKSQ